MEFYHVDCSAWTSAATAVEESSEVMTFGLAAGVGRSAPSTTQAHPIEPTIRVCLVPRWTHRGCGPPPATLACGRPLSAQLRLLPTVTRRLQTLEKRRTVRGPSDIYRARETRPPQGLCTTARGREEKLRQSSKADSAAAHTRIRGRIVDNFMTCHQRSAIRCA